MDLSKDIYVRITTIAQLYTSETKVKESGKEKEVLKLSGTANISTGEVFEKGYYIDNMKNIHDYLSNLKEIKDFKNMIRKQCSGGSYVDIKFVEKIEVVRLDRYPDTNINE